MSFESDRHFYTRTPTIVMEELRFLDDMGAPESDIDMEKKVKRCFDYYYH